MFRLRGALILALRLGLGTIMAGAFSMASIAVAWGLFIFSGSQSAQAWFILQLSAAGAGAGLGSVSGWFTIDRNTGLMVTLMIAVAVLGGLAGAWAGYEYGAYRSSICCAKSGGTIFFSPVTFSAMGATVMANLCMLLFAFARNRLAATGKLSHRLAPVVNGADGSQYRSVRRSN